MARMKATRRRATPVDDEPIFENGEVEEKERDDALSWYHHNQISTNILRS